MADSTDILGLVKESLDQGRYQDEHWQGSVQDYLKLVEDNPLHIRLVVLHEEDVRHLGRR